MKLNFKIFRNMNSLLPNVQNLLFVPQNEEYTEDTYRFWVKCVLAGETVVVLTHSHCPPKFLPLAKELEMDFMTMNEMLQRLIVVLFDDIDDLTGRLIELHEWVIKPTIIVIDLCSFVALHQPPSTEEANASTAPEPLLDAICHCIATLFNYMAAMGNDGNQATTSSEEAMAKSKDFKLSSIVILKEHAEVLTLAQLHLLLSLYYYRDSAFNDFKEVQRRILAADEA